MKKINVFFCAFLIFTANLYSQNEKETIDFLNSKLAIHTAPFVNEPSYYVLKAEIDSQTKRKIIIKETYISQKIFSIEKFYPKDINGIITDRNGYGNLILKIISNRGLIKRTFINRFNEKSKETLESETRLVLQTSDEEVYRIKKAFEHLLKLNGVEQANDNLFKD